MAKAKTDLVRYISPFNSPAWMPHDRARSLLERDDATYWEQRDCLPGKLAPHIEQ